MLYELQMHGYDLNGMPPLQAQQQQQQHSQHPGPPHPATTGQQQQQQLNGPGPTGGSLDSGLAASHHHPDSTDSYVTYLESDESMQASP